MKYLGKLFVTSLVLIVFAGGIQAQVVEVVEIGQIQTGNYAACVFADEDYAYFADLNRLLIYDLDDPSDPKEVGHYFAVHYILKVIVHESFAYISEGMEGLYVATLEDVKHTYQVGDYSPVDGYTSDFELVDDFIYIANGDRGMEIINIQSPVMPTFVGGYTFDVTDHVGFASEIEVEGNIAYVAEAREDKIHILDVSIPQAPVSLGYYNHTSDHIYPFAVKDKILYLPNWDEGIVAINTTDPKNPSIISTLKTGGNTTKVIVKDNYAFLADHQNGIVVVDISNSTNLKLLTQYYDGQGTVSEHELESGLARDIFLFGDKLYVAEREAGFEILQINGLNLTTEDNNKKDVYFEQTWVLASIIALGLKRRQKTKT
ncbi:MAG: LVIVD repeat-containing protein [Candidatus Kariarchaeaceae archaeon]|jgi:hypothetical protein